MPISIFYQRIIILVEPILLGGFKLKDYFLDVYSVDAKFEGCRSDRDFISDDRHDF